MPAEWEPHTATWLTWPHHRRDWPGKLAAIPWVFAEMARLLSSAERVRIVVQDRRERERATRTLERAGVDLSCIDFFTQRTNRSWSRDFMPLFVVRRRGRSASVAAVNFRFNGWGRYADHTLDYETGRDVAMRNAKRWFTSVGSGAGARLVLEGGGIDVDGLGTLITTEECLLTGRYARNRALGREGTEQALHDYLGVEKVIWMPSGIAGDDTSGHVDDFVRFVAPGKVVVCTESRRSDENHASLKRARRVLEAARDARGRRLEIIDLPMPDAVYYGGLRLPASYANFYIGNRVVLVPTFNDPQDRAALDILCRSFPRRDVVGVHARDLVLGLGTLHCSTMQEPTG
jgi:agmatine deiminase